MDQRWAVFYRSDQIICVRSWTREVQIVAEVVLRGNELMIPRIRGAFREPAEDDDFTIRLFDYLIQSHALNIVLPVPLPAELDSQPRDAAGWCYSMFGDMALLATTHHLFPTLPLQPLRTITPLHVAAARGDTAAATASIDGGVPANILASDGAAPLHWIAIQGSTDIGDLLIARGADCEVRDTLGRTPLMWCVEQQNQTVSSWLIGHGADTNALDHVGATALHCAAELGDADLVKILLDAGADASIRALGYDARSIAAHVGHDEIVKMLKDAADRTG